MAARMVDKTCPSCCEVVNPLVKLSVEVTPCCRVRVGVHHHLDHQVMALLELDQEAHEFDGIANKYVVNSPKFPPPVVRDRPGMLVFSPDVLLAALADICRFGD